MFIKSIIPATVLMLSSTFTFAQSPGSLDPNFGSSGIAIVGVNGFEYGSDVHIQSNGNILMAGYTLPLSDFDFSLVSLEPDGSLDIPFGTGARVTTDLGGTFDYITDVVIDASDNIVAVGVANINLDNEMALVRYLPDGSLDFSFANNGIALDTFGFSDPNAQAVDLDADGKIVVAGYSNGNTNTDLIVARFLTDGFPDATFSGDGFLTLDLGGLFNWATDVKVDANDKIVTVGTATDGSNGRFVIHRFFPDGSLDHTFGNNGTVLHNLGNGDAYANGMAIQPDGKIVVVGLEFNGTDNDMVVMRLNDDGSLDNTFNGSGFHLVDGGSGDDDLYDVVVLPDGKIAVTGLASNGATNDLVVLMFNSDGTVDSNFGNAGMVTISSPGEYYSGRSMVMEASGDLMIVGTRSNDLGTLHSYLALRLTTGLNIGIADFSGANAQLLVYPNPIQDAFTLNFTLEKAEQVDLTLHDTQGRLVHTFQAPTTFGAGEQKLSFNLPSTLAAGSYHLVLSNQHGQQQIQIIH